LNGPGPNPQSASRQCWKNHSLLLRYAGASTRAKSTECGWANRFQVFAPHQNPALVGPSSFTHFDECDEL